MSASEAWVRCRPYIEKALEYSRGTHTIEDIEDGVMDGRYQFWAADNSAVITEIIIYPRFKALNGFLIAGKLDELFDVLEPAIADFAKFAGCKRIEGTGRKGWERVGSRRGYTNGSIMMYKDLSP